MNFHLSLDEYADLQPPADASVISAPEAVIAEVIGSYERRELLAQLGQLRRMCDRPESWPRLLAYYRRDLGRFGPALDAAMTMDESKTRIVARQPVLAAIRELLRVPLVDGSRREQPILATALLLTHAAGSVLAADSEADLAGPEEMLGSFPAHSLLLLARNTTFYESDDPGAQLVRVWRLWREYEPSERKVRQLRAKPKVLLREATGLDFEDLITIGFAAWAHTTNRETSDPVLMPLDYFDPSAISPEKVKKFLDVLGATPEELRADLVGHTGHYDFLPMQAKPILKTEDGIFVMDVDYLLDRFTKGLYWIVHDYLKFELEDEDRRARWSEAHAEMVEKMVEDELHAMAPGLSGSPERAFYGEEDFWEAYGGRACDAGIDYGGRFLLFEIVDRQLSHKTRIEGDVESFKQDTERAVVGKCRQLDATARNILKDPSRLTKSSPVPNMKVVPVLVIAGGYPNDPISLSYVEELLEGKGLLKGDNIENLAIVDLAEVEMLEALAKTHHDLARIISDWKASSLAKVSLRNYLIRRFESSREKLRPKRMNGQIEELFAKLDARLRPPKDLDRAPSP